MRPGTKEPIGAGLPSLRPTFEYKYCVCLKRYCSKYSRRLSKTLRGVAQGDNCNLSNVTQFSKHSTSWQRRRWRQQLKPPRRQWRRWRQRRHESQLSSGLFQFWTACIFTCSCILVTCTLKASDLIGKNWTSKSEVCMWYNSIIQPPTNKARNPAPLIPLKLHLMGKLSNHFDPLPSS